MKPRTSSRRSFLKTSSLFLGSSLLCSAQVTGANTHVRIAVVGLRWKGKDLIRRFSALQNTKVVALCDVDSDILQQVAQQSYEHIGTVDLVTEYRDLLDRKDIDAVVLATPNHWHALQTIWACQAGKHVYVEKPSSHSVWEGQQMLEASRKYNRLVQVGLQSRSLSSLPKVKQWLQEGHIGKIKAIHAIWYRRRESVGKRDIPTRGPKSLDYDLWLGPAADEPIYRNNVHYDWHWDWNTGNGDMGNIGTHVIDIARFYLGDPDPSCRMYTFGKRLNWDDAANTPNMHVAAFNINGIPVILELNNLPNDADGRRNPAFRKIRRGQVVLCEGGFILGHGGGKAYDLEGNAIQKFTGSENHYKNFVDAIPSGDRSILKSELASGHSSCSLAIAAGPAYRGGEVKSASSISLEISSNPYLNDAFDRYNAQCKRVGINIDKDPWISSGDLQYDHNRGIFIAGELSGKANMFMKRNVYREPFSLPTI